jgi:tRNA threonylcarbamoyladenosine biosynthesis protein TsaB
MELTLVVETSSRNTSVAIGDSCSLLFHSNNEVVISENKLELATLVRNGLETIGKNAGEIQYIAVDIGPGRLISIRNGVAFANGLASATSALIYPFSSFELMGFEAWKMLEIPVLCTAKGGDGNTYVGLYDNGVSILRLGPLEELVREVTQGLEYFSVAGEFKDMVRNISLKSKVHDSGVYFGKANHFFSLRNFLWEQDRLSSGFVVPLNENMPFINKR